MVETYENGIAVIGMAGRFPGAPDLKSYWANLVQGVESIRRFSDQELAASGMSAEAISDPNLVKAYPVIDDAALFDAGYFNISSREAEFIDPQHRIFLECALHAIEDAGCDPKRYGGNIGVFGGTNPNAYQLIALRDRILSGAFGSVSRVFETLDSELMFFLGGDKDYLATRVSYKLDLRGPSFTVQTACSTSLVAIHLACQSLLGGECEVALAGGVSVTPSSYLGLGYTVYPGMSSPDGHCRPFDDSASGTVFGDGVGIVVLKRLDRALADGDHIRAVIRGSAINNDGSSKVGFAAPSLEGQASVIVEALAVAGLPASAISYVEAHGTGTPLGDPIEVASLTRAFRNSTAEPGFCGLGSVKSNIGHLNTAAGVAGLIKVILALENECLPPSINFAVPNRQITFEQTPFYVASSLKSWPRTELPRRAGINAFGIGGTNAHVIVEEAPSPRTEVSRKSWHVLPISAKTESALKTLSGDLLGHLSAVGEIELADLAHTLATGRAPHKYRRAIVCSDLGSAVDALRSAQGGSAISSESSAVHFMFPGQGTQRVNMGRSLYLEEPAYRAAFENCADILRGELDTDLHTLVFSGDGSEQQAAARLTRTEFAQPAIFSVSYAMAALWQARGVEPAGMIGHSVGELVAACLAGVFGLEDALKVVALRGRLMQRQPEGRMLVVPAPLESFQGHMGTELSLAAMNAPGAFVVSGPSRAIAEFNSQLCGRGIACSELHTSHAFHSAMMDGAVPPFVEVMARIRLRSPTIAFVSNVTGGWITAEQATDPLYWGRQLRATVRFADGMQSVLDARPGILVEVGPGRALSTLARQNRSTGAPPAIVASMPKPGDDGSELRLFNQAIADLWVAGGPVNWDAQYRGERRIKIPLPSYPFERQRYWPVSPSSGRAGKSAAGPRSRVTETGAQKRSGEPDFTMSLYWRSTNRALSTGVDLELGGQKWLIFSAGDELSRTLVEQLKGRGAEVVVVRMGDRYDSSTHELILSPASADDFVRLVDHLSAQAFVPQKVVYLWSLHLPPISRANLETTFEKALFGLMHLVQAWEHAEVRGPVKVAIIVSRTVDVLGGEVMNPVGAIARGPFLVVPLEHRNVSCLYMDIPSENTNQESQLAAQLICDIAANATPSLLAYRQGRVWTPAVERVALHAANDARSAIRQGGVYLITGGLGDLGLAVASGLADRGAAALVLCARTQLPNRSEWGQYLDATGRGDRVARIVEAIQKIEAKGAKVLVGTADVSDVVAMRDVIDKARVEFGQIHGVIHAAGLPGTNIIISQTNERMLPVLLTKIAGMLTIDELFDSASLDFVVLFSSLSAISGGVGMLDYVAANAFLDAYAASRSVPGQAPKVFTINWDIWGEIGMATHLPQGFIESGRMRLEDGIATDEGIDTMVRILQSRISQVIVSKNLSRQLSGAALGNIAPDRNENADNSGSHADPKADEGRKARPEISVGYVEPNNEIERFVAEFWANALNLDRVGIEDDFFELGGDSLLAMQMIPKLINRFQIELAPRDLFEAGTISGIARVIETKLIEEVEELEAV